MTHPTCKGCGAIIRWLKTPSGKSTPVDPDWLSEWVTEEPLSGSRRVTLVPGDGRKPETGWVASVITPGSRQIEGYVPHFATCPKAEQFRKRG